MEKQFIFCILLRFFRAQANETPTISNQNLNEEIMRITGEMRYMADPVGALIYRLANEILLNKEANQIIGEVKTGINEAKKKYETQRMKLLYRQAIEEIEDTFPKDTDEDFEKKKVKWDQDILRKKTGFDYHEERRRQKWLYYCNNPPNNIMNRIMIRANSQGLNPEELAFGVAKAHRRLSEIIHEKEEDPYNIEDPVKFFISKSVVESLRVILMDADIMDEYLPKILKTRKLQEDLPQPTI